MQAFCLPLICEAIKRTNKKIEVKANSKTGFKIILSVKKEANQEKIKNFGVREQRRIQNSDGMFSR